MKRAIGYLGLLVALVAGLVAAGAALWFIAPAAGSLRLLGVAALAIGIGAAALLGRLLGGWTRLSPRTTTLAPALGAGVLLLTGTAWLVTSPLASRPLAADPRGPNVQVRLPTGSTLATWTLPATGTPRRATPVIFLHGGAGDRAHPRDFAMGAPFRAAGFDTIYFDQAGSGRSADIPATDYSVARSVADLEALRRHLGADRLILWGVSWGATLAAAYGDAHPDRLAAVVALSPGEFPGTVVAEDWSKTDEDDSFSPPPRMAALYLLLGRAPQLAEQWLPQADHHRYQDALANPAMPGMRCKGAPRTPMVRAGGGSLYALRRIRMDVVSLPPPEHPRLAIPALIVRGDCDFVPASAAAGFAAAYTPARLVAVPGAGHMLLEHDAAFETAAADFAARDLAAVK